MVKTIVFFVLGALFGGYIGKVLVERNEAKHRHTRSVMTLLSFHQERLDAAAKASHCQDFTTEHARLFTLQQEIALAFPKAYQQEAGFKKSADALGAALQTSELAVAAPGTCPNATKLSQQISDKCEDCHKVYDPS